MKVAFTTTLDDEYFQGFLYTFSSILKNTPDFNYDLIILEWGNLSDQNKEIIKKLYSAVYFKSIQTEKYKNYEFDSRFRTWNYNCNYRFDIFLIDYDLVVYFDCDFLFEISAHELIKHEVDFGACEMPNKKFDPQINSSKIFNAGLMVIGKKYLKEDTKNCLLEIANNNPHKTKKWTGNQPILNRYFLDKITWLPINYNLISEDISIKSFLQKNNYHFVGKHKPWNKNLNFKYDKHILNCIANNNNGNIIFNSMVYKKIEEKYKELDFFLSKILF